MATLYSTVESSTTNAKEPRYVAPGVSIVRVPQYVSTAAFSAGDAITLVKVPHGATITTIDVVGGTPDGTTNFGIGVSGTTNLFGSATISATSQRVRLTTALPYLVSVSADATNRYITLLATVGTIASATASNSLAVIVHYVMDP